MLTGKKEAKTCCPSINSQIHCQYKLLCTLMAFFHGYRNCIVVQYQGKLLSARSHHGLFELSMLLKGQCDGLARLCNSVLLSFWLGKKGCHSPLSIASAFLPCCNYRGHVEHMLLNLLPQLSNPGCDM